MSYKRTLRGVDYLIENELDMAQEEHGEVFASMHEGERADFLGKEKTAQNDEKTPSNVSEAFTSISDDDIPW